MPLNPRSVDFKKVCGNVSRSINCFRVLESRITRSCNRMEKKKEVVRPFSSHLLVRIAAEPALPRDSTVPDAAGDYTRYWILLWQEDDKLIVRNLPDPTTLTAVIFAFSFGSFCQVLVGVDQLIDPHGGHGTITAREYQCVLYTYIFLLHLIITRPFFVWTPFALRPPSC